MYTHTHTLYSTSNMYIYIYIYKYSASKMYTYVATRALRQSSNEVEAILFVLTCFVEAILIGILIILRLVSILIGDTNRNANNTKTSNYTANNSSGARQT